MRTSTARGVDSGHGSIARGRWMLRVRKVVEDGAQLGRAEADVARGAQQLVRVDRRALGVVGDHVGEADVGGVALGVLGVVALDRGGDGAREVPAAGEDAADEGVVDAELAALVVQALLGRARGPVDLARVARVGVHEDELADVVQQGGDEQAVAVRVVGLGGEAVGGALDGDGVQAEALGGGVPGLAALEELEDLGGGGEALRRPRATGPRRRRRCDSTRPALLPPTWLPRRRTAMTRATSDSMAATTSPVRGALLGDEGEDAVAGLGEGREALQRLEGGGQPLAVAGGTRGAVRLRGRDRCAVAGRAVAGAGTGRSGLSWGLAGHRLAS